MARGSSSGKRSARQSARPPPSPRRPTVAIGDVEILPSASAHSEPKLEDSQFIPYELPESFNGPAPPSAFPPAGWSWRQEEDMGFPPSPIRIHEQAPLVPLIDPIPSVAAGVPLPSSSAHRESRLEDSQFIRYQSPESFDGSAHPPAFPPAGGSWRQEEDIVSPRSTIRIHEQAPTPSVRSLSRQEENIYGVPPVAGSSVGESVSRPLRLRLPGPEEPSHNSIPSATTITISVPPSTPARSSPGHDGPTQAIPHVVRSNVSESAHSPGYIEVGRREEPNYSAHPGTTITIRVDQPVREYHGRLPRHEEHLVGVSAPVGGSVGETVPQARPRRRTARFEEPNPSIPPMARSVSESPTVRRPRRRTGIYQGPIPSAPPLASRIVSEPLREHRYPRRRTLRNERPTPTAAPLITSRDRSASFPGITQPLPPPPAQRPPVLDVPSFTSSPVPASIEGEFVPFASLRSPVPDVLNYAPPPVVPWVYQPPPPVSPGSSMPGVSTSEVRPVAVPMFDRSLPPHPDPISPDLILNKIDPPKIAINGSLASAREVTPPAERIPSISPAASPLEVLTMRNASEAKQHQERWGVVNDKLGKVTRLVNDVVRTCANNNLKEHDLPRGLHTTFRSLKSQLGLIERAMEQRENAGVIKRVFLGAYSQRKVKAYDAKLSNELQSFQAALAFNPYFVQFAAQIEVQVTNVNARFDEDQTPLHVASQLGHVPAMRSLISRGANPDAENEDKETPLFLVSRNGNEEATKLLLHRSARVNHQDHEKRTPLHGASENGHDSVTRLLLKYRADSNARNMYEWTPLHLASRTGKNAVVRILLRWRADIDAPNDLGWTPLHMAAQKGHREVVELLLSKHAMVDTPEARGETALHLAAYYGHAEIVKLLINYGADVRIRTKERKTPLDLARREGHEDIVQLLEA